jgi:hypothetical protein
MTFACARRLPQHRQGGLSWTLTTSSRLIAAPQFGLTRWAVKDCSRMWHFGNIIEPCISPSPEQGWCEKGHAQTKR